MVFACKNGLTGDRNCPVNMWENSVTHYIATKIPGIFAEKKTEIMRETAHLTRRELIPAIEQFLQGLQACNNFFVVTGKNLGEIKKNAAAAEKKKMAEKKIKKEFQIMKLKAEDIRINCDIFFSAASEVRIKTNYCKIY